MLAARPAAMLLALVGASCASAASVRRAELAERLRTAEECLIDYRCARALPTRRVLAVNDPDAPCPGGKALRAHGVWLGYLSLGQVNEHLAAFAALRREGALRRADPRWPGAHDVDVLHPAWRARYVAPRVSEIAAAGFDGVFLDTLDAALSGGDAARRATVEAVRSVRASHPGWVLVPNGGLAAVDALLPLVDAWAVEDVFAGFDRAAGYRPTAPARQAVVLPALRRLRARGVPVFVLDYLPAGPADLAAPLRARCAAEGFHCAFTPSPTE